MHTILKLSSHPRYNPHFLLITADLYVVQPNYTRHVLRRDSADSWEYTRRFSRGGYYCCCSVIIINRLTVHSFDGTTVETHRELQGTSREAIMAAESSITHRVPPVSARQPAADVVGQIRTESKPKVKNHSNSAARQLLLKWWKWCLSKFFWTFVHFQHKHAPKVFTLLYFYLSLQNLKYLCYPFKTCMSLCYHFTCIYVLSPVVSRLRLAKLLKVFF